MARSSGDAVETWSTGHAALDAALPGGGWPLAGLVEVLPPQPGQFVWRLLAPGLSQVLAHKAGPLVLVGAPFEPFAPNLQAQGLAAARLLCVRAGHREAPGAQQARLWAAQHALQCAPVVAVLLWLEVASQAPPNATNSAGNTGSHTGALATDLRRLHLIAQTQHKPLFVMRPPAARREASAAPLRLSLRGLEADDHTRFEVDVFKRRGSPVQPVSLPAEPVQLAALLQAAREIRAQELEWDTEQQMAQQSEEQMAQQSLAPHPAAPHTRARHVDRALTA